MYLSKRSHVFKAYPTTTTTPKHVIQMTTPIFQKHVFVFISLFFFYIFVVNNRIKRKSAFSIRKMCGFTCSKKVREKSRECHNHKPQPFPDPKRKRKPTNPNKHKSNKRTKSIKISSLFPKSSKSHLSISSPLIHSLVTNTFVSRQCRT